MRKNVAGQKIGAEMVSASDGSAFTGDVTAYVTVDAGTQTLGASSSGACTHEGNGYHTYGPSSSETNGDLLAFTFIGTGAVPATVQVMTDASIGADAAALLRASALGIVSGSASTNELTDSTMTTDLTEATNDHYNGRAIVWTGGVLSGQASVITDYDGASKKLTFAPVTEAPSTDSTFVLV